MMNKLTLICEGNAHTVEYLHKNGVYPAVLVFDALRFREIMPYLTKEDEVLAIIKGLTEFTLAEIYVLLGDIERCRGSVGSIVVMSNLILGNIQSLYYLYSGDLFYGSVKKVQGGKVQDLLEGKGKRAKKKGKIEKINDDSGKNSIMFDFKRYNCKDVRSIIHGRKPKAGRAIDEEEEFLVSKIVPIDLF